MKTLGTSKCYSIWLTNCGNQLAVVNALAIMKVGAEGIRGEAVGLPLLLVHHHLRQLSLVAGVKENVPGFVGQLDVLQLAGQSSVDDDGIYIAVGLVVRGWCIRVVDPNERSRHHISRSMSCGERM